MPPVDSVVLGRESGSIEELNSSHNNRKRVASRLALGQCHVRA